MQVWIHPSRLFLETIISAFRGGGPSKFYTC